MFKLSKTTLLTAFFIVYFISAFAYIIYSDYAQSGLCGYLTYLQINWFGQADGNLTFIAAMGILMLPISPVYSYFNKKQRELQTESSEQNPALFNGSAQRSAGIILMIISFIPTIVAVPAYFLLINRDQEDQQRQIYNIDLEKNSALPAADAKFIEFTGMLQPNYSSVLEERLTSSPSLQTFYIPLTSLNWDQNQPVIYVLKINNRYDQRSQKFVDFGLQDKKTNRIINLSTADKPFAVAVNGKLVKDGLPVTIAKGFEKHGLTLASPYYVLDFMNPFNGKVPSQALYQSYELIPFLGIFFNVLIGVMGFLLWRVGRVVQSKSESA